MHPVFLLPLFALATNAKLSVRREHGVKETGPINLRAATPVWGTFTQQLDHFNPLDTTTWSMRYISNDQFFEAGGPIFIYLGGEWTIAESSLMRGQVFDMAEEHHGYMFYTEHRFYGESYPTDDYSVENFHYHTTDQALEDIATFITYQKSLEQFKDSKVIVIGGSYSATLATWMRLKYPHLVDIAYSSSAPLEAIVDYYEYLEVVNDAIEATDSECLETIKAGFEEIEEFLQDPNGTAYISQLFRTCQDDVDISVEPERAYFFSFLVYAWAGIVQYASGTDIQGYCDVIKETEGTDTEKLLAFLESRYGKYTCMDSYNDYIEEYQNTELTTSAGRQWEYQTCTQYGFYQTTASEKQPFGNAIPIDFFIQSCQDIFGVDTNVLQEGIERTNIIYGAKNVVATKVINVHGANDPWHRAGIVLGDIHETSPTIVIEGASHCQDLSSANNETDTPQLYEAKERIKRLIRVWLKGEEEEEEEEEQEEEEEEGEENGAEMTYLNLLLIGVAMLLRNLV